MTTQPTTANWASIFALGLIWGEPLCKPGDYVILRAAMDCIVVLSTCPQDMIPINGAACMPTEVHFRVID